MAHSGTREGRGLSMEVGVRLPRLLREQRFVFCLCLFANFLASHVCLALRLYNAPINWVRQPGSQASQAGKAATEARACFKCLINAPLCCQLTQLIHINAPNHQPQSRHRVVALCKTVANCRLGLRLTCGGQTLTVRQQDERQLRH